MHRICIPGMFALISLLLLACSPATQEPVAESARGDVQPTATPPISTAVSEPTATPPISTPPPETTVVPSTSTAAPWPTAGVLPTLSTELVRGCEARDRSARGPQAGEPAIEFTLMDVDGDPYTLSELLQEKPVVLIFGSFT